MTELVPTKLAVAVKLRVVELVQVALVWSFNVQVKLNRTLAEGELLELVIVIVVSAKAVMVKLLEYPVSIFALVA